MVDGKTAARLAMADRTAATLTLQHGIVIFQANPVSLYTRSPISLIATRATIRLQATPSPFIATKGRYGLDLIAS